MQAYGRAHVTEKGVAFERGGDTTVEAELPIIAKCRAFDQILG